MQSKQIIETGVDRLVELLKKKGKVSFQDAARELGVSLDVIGEWAGFLNEEGILGIEYKFTTPFLIEKKISKAEIEKKVNEFSDKKDIFVRNAEGTVSVLQREAENMKRVKGEFEKLKKDLGFDLEFVKKELADLERLEKTKEELSRKLAEERKAAEEKIDDIKAIVSRERARYDQLIREAADEKRTLEGERKSATSLEQQGKTLRAEMITIKNLAKELEDKIEVEDASIRNSEQHIDKLQEMAEEIRLRITQEKDSLEPLLKRKEEQERQIKSLQQAIIEKIGAKSAAKEKASDQMRKFFEEKMKASMLVEKLNEERDGLERDLGDLIKKAKAFQLTAKGKDLEKEIKDIEGKFQEMEKRKDAFESEFKKLGELSKQK